MVEDEEMRKKIREQLYWDARVDALKIKVEVNGGVATLSGEVPSQQAKRSAAYNAHTIRGIHSVNNNLKVKYRGVVLSDEDIAHSIKQSLMWDSDIDALKVDVGVESGVVTLKGSVDAYWKKYWAESHAGDISGVLDVRNELTIVPTEKVSDEVLAKEIMESLKRNMFTEPEDIDVSVSNGIAKLSGTVKSWFIKNQAIGAADYTHGVKEVDASELDFE